MDIWSCYYTWLALTAALFPAAVSNKMLLIPFPVGSHAIWMANIGRQLIKDGHEVHVILPLNSGLEEKYERHGVSVLTYGTNSTATYTRWRAMMAIGESMVKLSLQGKFGIMALSDHFNRWMTLSTEEGRVMLSDETFLARLKQMNFGMAVLDLNPVSLQNYVLFCKVQIPYISVTWTYDSRISGIPAPVSFVPFQYFRSSDQISFGMRVVGLLAKMTQQIVPKFRSLPAEVLFKEHCGHENAPATMIRDSRLFIHDISHPVDYPRPSLPHVILVGALTIAHAKPLSGELQSFVDGAEHGIIAVSMGTYVKMVPSNMAKMFADAFKRVKQRVIWRHDGPAFDVSENVRLVSWLPQNDLLGHPKTRLFITHCGNNGQYESIYHGVPMIGFPLFVDQHYNAHRIVTKGYGIEMDFSTFTAEDLYNNIMEILNNPNYTENVKLASAIMKDDGQLPVEKAAYWINHVTKYGADHLRSPAIHMPWYTFWCLDAILVVLCSVSLMLFLLFKTIKMCYKFCKKERVKFKKS